MTLTAAARSLGRIRTKSSALFICDVQDKFRAMISHFDQIAHNTNRVLNAAKIMEMPVLATEQYPKGLGSTVPEVELAKFDIKAHPKTCFTMCLPDLMEELKVKQPDTKSIILCGIETQACIHHTSLDLMEQGFEVHIPVDCVSSRSQTDRRFALARLRDVGAFLTTSECVILGLAPDSAHPKFKGLQKIIMTSAPDTGLLDPL